MEPDIKVRKVAQDVLIFVCFTHEIIAEIPMQQSCYIPDVSAELINNLSISVLMEIFHKRPEWEDIVKTHFTRMTSSPYLFATYVAYTFDILGQTEKAYDYFFDVLSLLTYYVMYSWQSECKEFINAYVELLCAYFEQNIRSKFETQGGWKHFNEYLETRFPLSEYRSLISDNKSLFEYLKTFQGESGKSDKLEYANNIVCIVYVGQKLVESDIRAVGFAKYVENKITELCKKEFDEILMDFARTDCQVKAIYRETVGDTSDGMAREVKCSSSPKVQKVSESIPNKYESEKKEHERQEVTASGTLENQNLGNINSQDVDALVKVLQDIPKPSKSERAKHLLGDISMDIEKLSDAIQSLCKEYGVYAPVNVAESAL